jgi:hypothetical protein
MAVLLMDTWSGHITNDVIGLLIEGRVSIITFALHTTKIIQVFDATLFDLLRRHPRRELAFADDEVTVQFLMKVNHGFKQITVDSNG